MPPHSSYNLDKEKSPIDPSDYQGLQLDTRAIENQDKDLDSAKPQGLLDDDFDHPENYVNEKQAHSGVVPHEFVSPTTPGFTNQIGGSGPSPVTPVKPEQTEDSLSSEPDSQLPEQRICGLRRRHFWELFGFVLVIVLTAAVVGGVVGGLRRNNGNSSPTSSQPANNTNSNDFVPLQPGDVQVGSPLAIVSYDEGPPETLEARQAFRLYFQSALGNIKEATSYHLQPWSSALPIFTDAINNTGLASITYSNRTSQQGSIFYVGTNGLMQEKRKIYNDTLYWEPGTLDTYNFPAVGNISVPAGGNDPENDWDSYRMAAVYSTNFSTGPEARLFYHSLLMNGTSFVQELIWNQKNDSWSSGSRFRNAWPNSHLAATVDETAKILRLYFSSGDNTLQEMWLSMTEPNAQYTAGLSIPNLLEHNNADIAAVSLNGTTRLYYYAPPKQTQQAGIRELTISGTPGSINNQETFNLSSPLVANPQLSSNNKDSSYQPLGVANTVVPGLDPQVYVFWADKISGDPTTTATGYTELAEINKPLKNSTWPSSGQLAIPLGDSNSQPSS